MKIAILGAGFTGLTAALDLLEKGHKVTIFEKESDIGGLAIGFKQDNWDWSLEKAYHHWFTNDTSALNLAKKLNHQVIIKRPQTNVFIDGKITPLDSPLSLLTFPYLPLIDKLKTGATLAYLKFLNNHQKLEGKKALPWIKKYMGQKSLDLIWDPLFTGKFGNFKDDIALTWFWARIKKRTPSLAYPEGGFKVFADNLADKVSSLGGEVLLNTPISEIKKTNDSKFIILNSEFDKVLVTLPSPIFTKITPNLPPDYVQNITSIPHLHAQVLILIFKKPFMGSTYWLNITQKDFPFLVLAEHTNFMDSKYYGGQHLLYIGNYLPPDHPYLKMSKEELLEIFDPYLKKINPDYNSSLVTSHLFTAPFAQPIMTVDYQQKITTMYQKQAFKTPIEGIYLANLDMVYPWDRGTNYAIEMGEMVAKLIDQNER